MINTRQFTYSSPPDRLLLMVWDYPYKPKMDKKNCPEVHIFIRAICCHVYSKEIFSNDFNAHGCMAEPLGHHLVLGGDPRPPMAQHTSKPRAPSCWCAKVVLTIAYLCANSVTGAPHCEERGVLDLLVLYLWAAPKEFV